MEQYLQMLQYILDNGERVSNRTGIDTISVFGYQTRYDLQKGFPIVTTKKMFFKGIVYELLWFLRGDTNVKFLQENGVHIWDEWATKEMTEKFGREEGELGPIYGELWRKWKGIDDLGNVVVVDQIKRVIDEIKNNPNSRRLIVSGWNPATCDRVSLPPCHTLFQFKITHGNKLNCHLYQRSADAFLGVPFNISSYALLTHMIAHVTGLNVGEFIHSFGDLHIYVNHLEQVKLQLSRKPLELPKLWLNPNITSIDDFKYEDVKLIDYKSWPAIKGEVAV